MKKFIFLIALIFISPLSVNAIQNSYSDISVAIISDHILPAPTTYYNYPAASELFANEITNQLRLRNNVRTISHADVREILARTTYTHELKKFVTQYRLNYNIDFSKIRAFAKVLNTTHILLVTSDIDYQSYVMKGTIWNVLNIPGADVINPVYQVVTNVSLIDVQRETVVWQNVYRKNLKARDNSIIGADFPPNTQQLKAVSDYSKTLSYFVANAVEEHTCPKLYYDALGNRYNKKSNSLVGKTKYYTRSVYENYVGVDVPGPNAENRKANKEKKAQEKARQKQIKLQEQEKLKEQPQNFDNNYVDVSEEQEWEQELINSDPMKEYYQNDNIKIKPEKTPDAAGNKYTEPDDL